jgi:copper transport protein
VKRVALKKRKPKSLFPAVRPVERANCRTTPMRNFFVVLFLFLYFGLGAPGSAFAHATPLEYSPEASAVLDRLPDEIAIRFSERLDPKASGITVFDPRGGQAHQGAATVDPEDRYMLRVKISDAGRGTYAVSWSVVSADDGHFTKGAFVFSVGEETVTSGTTFDIIHRSAFAQSTSVALELIGYALLWGFLFLHVVSMRLGGFGSEQGRIFPRSRAVLWAGVACIVAGNAGYIFFESRAFAGAQDLAFTQGLAAFIQTKAGMLAAARALFSLMYPLFLMKFFRKGEDSLSGRVLWFYAVAAVVLCYLRTLSSHGAAATVLPAITFGDHMIQLAAKQMWAGSILVFALCLFPYRVSGSVQYPKRIFTYLSAVVFLVAGLVFASGSYIVWLDLKTFGNIFLTDWGKRFIGVSLASGLLLVLRMVNMWFYERPIAREGRERPRGFSFFLPLEACVGVLMLIFSAFAMMTTPPVAISDTVLRETESQGVKIMLSCHPYEKATVRITFADAQSPAKEAGKIEKLTVFLTNAKEGIGPIVVPAFRRSENSFVIDAKALTPAGLWRIDIEAARAGSYDAVAHFDIDSSEYAALPAPGQEELRGRRFSGIIFGGGFIAMLICLGLAYIAWKGSGAGIAGQDLVAVSGLRWLFAAIVAIIAGASLVGGQFFLKSSFERDCVAAGNMWHVSVPIREGMATSPLAVPGCMFGYGSSQFHFADEAEYRYFVKSAVVDVAFRYDTPTLREHVQAAMSFKITEDGLPATDLVHVHERLLHAIIIGEDLETFAHIHPEDFGKITEEMKNSGTYSVAYHPMRAGRYLVAVDAQVRATPVTKYEIFRVEGADPMVLPSPDFATMKNFDGYDVELKIPTVIRAGDATTIAYRISKNGIPVTDMAPYLGAPMHLAIVKDNLSDFMHTHGEVHASSAPVSAAPVVGMAHMHAAPPKAFGPDVEAHVLFPKYSGRGTYYIFGQFQHAGAVIVTKFAVKVY